MPAGKVSNASVVITKDGVGVIARRAIRKTEAIQEPKSLIGTESYWTASSLSLLAETSRGESLPAGGGPLRRRHSLRQTNKKEMDRFVADVSRGGRGVRYFFVSRKIEIFLDFVRSADFLQGLVTIGESCVIMSVREKKTKTMTQADTKMSPKNILLIEDDVFIFDIYQTKFTQEGHNIIAAHSGEEALEKLQAADRGEIPRPDLILCDIIMTGMGGMGFLEEKAKNSAWDDIPLIMLTNLSEPEHIKMAEKYNAIGYIVKANHTPSEILRRIGEYMAEYERRARGDGESADEEDMPEGKVVFSEK